MTSVAVELAGADGEKHYIVIHHLYYDTQPSSRYTEGMTVWPVWKMENSWRPGTLCSGRVLCARRGTAQTAALHGLAYDDRQVTGFFGTDRRASFDAQWTRPSGAGDVRMYMLYDAFCGGDAWVLTSYGNYTRQSKPVYPFDGSMLRWGMGDRGACTRYMGYVQNSGSGAGLPVRKLDAPHTRQNSVAYNRDKGRCHILIDAVLSLAGHLAAVSNLTKSTKAGSHFLRLARCETPAFVLS